jgi:hypothetical protein
MGGRFDRARAAAVSAERYPGDLDALPEVAYSPQSRRLLTIAARAWVFGGMGSWNDLSFEDRDAQGRYEKVSEDLYRSVLAALVAATNAELAAAS